MTNRRYYRVSDGAPATEGEATDAAGVLRDGFGSSMSVAFADSIGMPSVRPDAAHARFTDAAGKPVRLIDADRGTPVDLSRYHVEAIEVQARAAGLPVSDYLRDTLRYLVEATS